MKNVRSSQPRISMNFCTEFSKAQVFPCVYRQKKFTQNLENSVLLTYFFWRKSFVWRLKHYLNLVSAIRKHFLSGLLGADITALYTMFAVKHLLSSVHSALFLQLHPWL